MSDSRESVIDVISVLPKDAVPSINDPMFGDDYFGDPNDGVLVVEPADDASARQLHAHRCDRLYIPHRERVQSANDVISSVGRTRIKASCTNEAILLKPAATNAY